MTVLLLLISAAVVVGIIAVMLIGKERRKRSLAYQQIQMNQNMIKAAKEMIHAAEQYHREEIVYYDNGH